MPGLNCEWDMQKVYVWGASTGLSKAAIDHMFTPISPSQRLIVGDFDRKSVMMYQMPPSLFLKGANSPCCSEKVNDLSTMDKLTNSPFMQLIRVDP
jgi:hypothetical protein